MRAEKKMPYFWLLNTVFFILNVPGFGVTQYRTKIMYSYAIDGDTHFLISYIIAGIAVSLAMFKITTIIRERLLKLTNSQKYPPVSIVMAFTLVWRFSVCAMHA